MSRRHRAEKREIIPDPKYGDIVLSKFMEGGLSGRNLKLGNQERFRIMSKYYGFLPTLLRHLLFAIRLTTFFIRHRRI